MTLRGNILNTTSDILQRKYVKQHIRKSHSRYLLNEEVGAEIQPGPISDFMKQTEIKLIQGVPRKFFRCTICLNKYQKKYVKHHIRKSHAKYLAITEVSV